MVGVLVQVLPLSMYLLRRYGFCRVGPFPGGFSHCVAVRKRQNARFYYRPRQCASVVHISTSSMEPCDDVHSRQSFTIFFCEPSLSFLILYYASSSYPWVSHASPCAKKNKKENGQQMSPSSRRKQSQKSENMLTTYRRNQPIQR